MIVREYAPGVSNYLALEQAGLQASGQRQAQLAQIGAQAALARRQIEAQRAAQESAQGFQADESFAARRAAENAQRAQYDFSGNQAQLARDAAVRAQESGQNFTLQRDQTGYEHSENALRQSLNAQYEREMDARSAAEIEADKARTYGLPLQNAQIDLMKAQARPSVRDEIMRKVLADLDAPDDAAPIVGTMMQARTAAPAPQQVWGEESNPDPVTPIEGWTQDTYSGGEQPPAVAVAAPNPVKEQRRRDAMRLGMAYATGQIPPEEDSFAKDFVHKNLQLDFEAKARQSRGELGPGELRAQRSALGGEYLRNLPAWLTPEQRWKETQRVESYINGTIPTLDAPAAMSGGGMPADVAANEIRKLGIDPEKSLAEIEDRIATPTMPFFKSVGYGAGTGAASMGLAAATVAGVPTFGVASLPAYGAGALTGGVIGGVGAGLASLGNKLYGQFANNQPGSKAFLYEKVEEAVAQYVALGVPEKLARSYVMGQIRARPQ